MGKYLLKNCPEIPLFMFILFLGASFSCSNPDHKIADVRNTEYRDTLNYGLSPYTGFTRNHWLEITERILTGALAHFDPATGLPEQTPPHADSTYDRLRYRSPGEDGKRSLERIMIAAIIYTGATGNDSIPGYSGSVSAPFIKAIIAGTDPKSPLYWGEPLPNDQVGSAFAMGIYIDPEHYWKPFSDAQKKNLLDYFKKQVFNKTYDNNHYLFHMVPVELLDNAGYESNRKHLTKMYERMLGWYSGDGWFIDGTGNQGYDYYNLWGFQLFNQVLYKYDPEWRKLFGEKIRNTSSEFFKTLPYLFGKDGGPIPWGRSLSYRFAGNSAIAWAVINGNCTLQPGQARRIASGNLKYFWEHGCLGDDKLLSIGYWDSNTSLSENYMNYFDPYWACQGLACLLIPEDDPFWRAVEEPIPADGKGGRMAVTGAQFVLRVSPVDGEARMFPAGQPWAQDRKKWQTGAKYDQNSYSSYLGFCVLGENGEDAGAGRTGYSFDGVKWFYRERARPIKVDTSHIISVYTLIPEKRKDTLNHSAQYEIITHTLIGNDGEVLIFWHNNPDPVYLYFGGYGISVPYIQRFFEKKNTGNILISGGDYYSVLNAIDTPGGIFESQLLEPIHGWKYTHLFGGMGAFPYWKSSEPVPSKTPVIMYVNGTKIRKPVLESVKENKQGNLLNIKFEGREYQISLSI